MGSFVGTKNPPCESWGNFPVFFALVEKALVGLLDRTVFGSSFGKSPISNEKLSTEVGFVVDFCCITTVGVGFAIFELDIACCLNNLG